jgi:hypothetical protein
MKGGFDMAKAKNSPKGKKGKRLPIYKGASEVVKRAKKSK